MIFKSNRELPVKKNKKFIFLAGSMDDSKNNWRNKLMNKFDYHFFDPTNENHGFLNETEMKNHVTWELDAMAKSDIIFMNLLPNSSSPISLVELGLHISTNKMIVVCPKEFYKSNYVNILCEKHHTPIFNSLEEATKELIKNYK